MSFDSFDNEMLLFTVKMNVLKVIVFLILIGSSKSDNNNDLIIKSGYPKFPNPQQSCGVRGVDWNPRSSKVIGGESPPLGAVPWIVDLIHKGRHHCGGVLISSRLILTVAHCYLDGLSGRVGQQNETFEQILKVEKSIVHPDHRKSGPYSNDIALLLVSKPGFTRNKFIKPACVPKETPPEGTRCEVSGWGIFNPHGQKEISSTLQTATVPLLSSEICKKGHILGGKRQEILETMVCAGKLRGGVDACGGDSGGPLMCFHEGKFVLTGLVSWGDGCAKKHKPGVYTKVSSYKDWIVKTAEELGIKSV
ncbi:trypsin-like [Onthophagus taurus]|uniref:trypsin-like n=1 Tax=Onthophagus taurus TaxID=166361 RepID=UPI0039BDFC86